MTDDEDGIQINTSNQAEQDKKLAKKKKFLADKQDKNIKAKKINGTNGGIKKKLKSKQLDSNGLQKKIKKVKNKLLNNNDPDSNQISSLDQNENENENDDTSNHENESFKQNQSKKYEKNFNRHQTSSQISSATSKMAKFSSLFKNNHDIPRVGDTEATTDLVKESLFSKNSFAHLNLSAHLTDCLEKRFKLNKMTQIQEKSIPAILSGKDCFIKSQTGSGKTLAYAIPIIQSLQSRQPRLKRSDGIRALVLVPTRELATQTCQVFEQLCNACIWIVPGSLIGGMKKKSEKDRIRRGLNILVATPGRLCDHLDTTLALDLSKIEFLIFDEADRMLDLDFEKKINFIIFKIHSARKKALAEPLVPKYKLDANGEPVEDKESVAANTRSTKLDPQTILISATLTNGIKEIARRLNISDAVNIDATLDTDEKLSKSKEDSDDEMTINGKKASDQVEKISLPAGLTHYYMMVPSKLRLIGLISFILDKLIYQPSSNAKKMVIFAATNDSVQFHENVLKTFLNRKFNMYLEDDDENDIDYNSDLESYENRKVKKKDTDNSPNKVCDLFSLYGNMDQHKRAEILARFCKVSSGVLICTDVAARGLDMPNIDWIIQYNTPGSCVDYVHRVGRTARVGHKGKAIIFLEPCEVEYLKELNKLGISLRETKLDSVLDCLIDEAKYYPRQVNSDRLVFGKNSEECANSMQFYIEEYVEKATEIQTLARKAYLSFLRSYSCYSSEWKKIFHLKNLHLGHVAKSFGLREAPNQIAGNDFKLYKENGQNNYISKGNNSNYNKNGNREDYEYDKLSSKYARDLKRLSNGHKEYGNVIKKNKLKSQRTEVDLSGLLKKNKNAVSEYSSGFETGQTKFKSTSYTSDSSNLFNRNSNGPTQSYSVNGTKSEKKMPIKIVKKNMAIFD